jgi:hypothetical protein
MPSSTLKGVIILFSTKRPYNSAQLETDTTVECAPYTNDMLICKQDNVSASSVPNRIIHINLHRLRQQEEFASCSHISLGAGIAPAPASNRTPAFQPAGGRYTDSYAGSQSTRICTEIKYDGVQFGR